MNKDGYESYYLNNPGTQADQYASYMSTYLPTNKNDIWGSDEEQSTAVNHSTQDDNEQLITKGGWTAPQRVWGALENKEEIDEMAMQQHFAACQAKMQADFMVYKEEMKQRRQRYLNKVGPQITVEQAYHIPFWQWWGEYLTRKY